jgi:hypothetical protein
MGIVADAEAVGSYEDGGAKPGCTAGAGDVDADMGCGTPKPSLSSRDAADWVAAPRRKSLNPWSLRR